MIRKVNLMKIIFYIIMAVAFILVTFFGIGPVLFADGQMAERMFTLAIVILIYLILIFITIVVSKRMKSSGK